MNDPVALAATQGDSPREFPATTGAATATATSAEPIRTLLETAGTCRPLEEVAEPYESVEQYRRRPYGRIANGTPAAPARAGALRHVLRRPVAAALLVCVVLHLPGDLTALWSQTPTALLPLLATVLCLGLGALPAVRDTAAAWRAGAASASPAWAGVTAVLCAAAAAVLAGLALLNRSPQARAGAGG
ncbi:hypothetical protein [Streptomyces sp. NBC_00069]|uniref:hypothetical protein n=1 Tax=Streptomyces sp. NBC_00069 TaxID=2975639 RepID=UPI00324C987A|nr:hypothetical protein OG513_36290 [Streptomyces sp. NBC_00998]